MGGERLGLPHDRAEVERLEQVVDQAVLLVERAGEDEGHGDRGDDVGDQDTHAPEGLGADVLVEDRGDRDGGDQLRDGRQQEDADRVEERVPEERVGEFFDVVAEADPLAGTGEEVPVVQRDDEGVAEGEQPDQAEEDEERRYVEVGRGLDVEAAELLAELEPAARGSLRAGGAPGRSLRRFRALHGRGDCGGHARFSQGLRPPGIGSPGGLRGAGVITC